MHDFRIIVDPCFRPKFAFVSPDTIPDYPFTPPLFNRFAAAPVRRVHDNALERVCVSAAES